MRIALSLLISLLVITANAESIEAPIGPSSDTSIFRSRSLSLVGGRSIANEQSLPISEIGLGIGYFPMASIELALEAGRFSTGARTLSAGGSLSDWQYVETRGEAKGLYLLAETRFWFTPNPAASRGFFVGAGIEHVRLTARFEYVRYKPYNGTICIGSCDKVPEESESGESSFAATLARVSFGYGLEMGKGFFADMSLLISGNYRQALDPHDVEVGATRKGRVGTELIGTTSLGAALVKRF